MRVIDRLCIGTIAAVSVFVYCFFYCYPTVIAPEVDGDVAAWNVYALEFVSKIASSSGKDFFASIFTYAPHPRHGVMYCYVMAPFLLFGQSLEVFRWVAFAVGLIYLFFVWMLLRKMFNSFVAVITMLFISMNSYFIIMLKHGGEASMCMHVFTLATLACLFAWSRYGSHRWFYAAMFVLGLGINTKLYYGWFVVAVLCSAGYLWRCRLVREPRLLFIGGILICLGALPALLTLYMRGDFFREILSGFMTTEHNGGISNPCHGFSVRLLQMRYSVLSYMHSGRWYQDVPFYTFIGAFILFPIVMKMKRCAGDARYHFLIYGTCIGIMAQSLFTPTDYYVGHMWVVFLLMNVLVAIFFFELSHIKVARLLTYCAVPIVAGSLFIGSLAMAHTDRMQLHQDKECGYQAISEWLSTNKDNERIICIAYDGYASAAIWFYSKLRLHMQLINESGEGDAFLRDVSTICEGDVVVIVNKNFSDDELVKRVSFALSVLRRQGLGLTVEKQFYSSDGEERAIACGVRPIIQGGAVLNVSRWSHG